MDYRDMDRIFIEVDRYQQPNATVVFVDGKIETARFDRADQLVSLFKVINPKFYFEELGNNRYELHRQRPQRRPAAFDKAATQYQNLPKLDYSNIETLLPPAPDYTDFGAEYEVASTSRAVPANYALGFQTNLSFAKRIVDAVGGIWF